MRRASWVWPLVTQRPAVEAKILPVPALRTRSTAKSYCFTLTVKSSIRRWSSFSSTDALVIKGTVALSQVIRRPATNMLDMFRRAGGYPAMIARTARAGPSTLG